MSRVVWLCVVPIEIFMRQLILWTACCAVVGWTNVVHSASNLLPDYSGVYACKGQDAHEGPYDGKVILKAVPEQSKQGYQAYSFELQVPGFGSYPGHAAGRGNQLAIYFANVDPKDKDFGTGLATFKRNAKGQWRFTKYYYQPEYKGGNHGFETCEQIKSGE